jgi:hypothetical protein
MRPGHGEIQTTQSAATCAASASGNYLERAVSQAVEPDSTVRTGWLGWLQRIEGSGLPTRGHPSDACGGREPAAAGQPGGGPAETLVARNTPGSRATRALGLLSGRVHVSVQSPHVRVARFVVLSPVGSSGASAPGADAHAERWRRPLSPITRQGSYA